MRSRRGIETDARVGQDRQLALGVVGVALSGLAVHDQTIGPVETTVFRAVNRLPDQLYPPAWVLMQAGNVNAAPIAGLVALRAKRPKLAARLTLTGLATWTLAKLIKKCYRRPRPAYLIAGVRCRGREPSGLGYVSGHTGIVTGIVVAAVPALRGPARVAVAAAVPTVGLCRMYVGAHLPLDVVGGAALGLAVDAVVSRLISGDLGDDRPQRVSRPLHDAAEANRCRPERTRSDRARHPRVFTVEPASHPHDADRPYRHGSGA